MDYYAYTRKLPNGRVFYVGKGKRRRAFDMKSNRNIHHRRIVDNYGAGNITVSILPCASETAAFAVERILIKAFRMSGAKLTNMTDGGDGQSGWVPSKEYREAARIRMKNRVVSQETRARMSIAFTGRKMSPEAIAKLKAVDRSYLKGKPSHNLGKPHTAETKKKISDAFKGRPKPKTKCSVCNRLIANNMLHRFHEENCKSLKEDPQGSPP